MSIVTDPGASRCRARIEPVTARWPTLGRRIAALVAAVGIVAGCSDRPLGSVMGATVQPLASPTPAGGSPTPGPSLASQSDTAWGRIWDALPPWFPIPVGATPIETGTGPTTAELALASGTTARDTATFFQGEFRKAGFAAVLDGPLEDGSFVVSVPGLAGGCQIEVRVVPKGTGVVARVLYGAGCPFE
jgi:hypothetical protein